MSEPKCPSCSSNECRRAGFYTLADGERSRRYQCRRCRRKFPLQYFRPPAQPSGEICPKCNSPNTIKTGKPVEWKHSLTQRCRCKDCGKQFTLGSRKKLMLFLNGELIYRCWNPLDLVHVPDVVCPNCNQKKAILKSEYQDGKRQQKICLLLCLSCSQEFKGEGTPWKNSMYRKLGKTVPRRSWQFDDDLWDLRQLYPNFDEHKFTQQLFLNFSNSGSDGFKKLIKKYVLWLIQSGAKPSTLRLILCCLSFLGRFLHQQIVTSMEEVNRQLLGIYWAQERGKLSRESLKKEKNHVKKFFEWGNNEQHFTTPTTLITTFNRSPKTFKDEPDPLEESVLQAIRDNLHVLPEPLQLMFMLGFWLGARPNELCYIRKDCLNLDPDGSMWWVEFERQKVNDENRLIVETDIVRLIQQQQIYINELQGEDYPYLFCHYQGIGKMGYPNYPRLMAIKRPPLVQSSSNPMVKVIRHLIEQCEIKDSNGTLARFTGAILRPSRATHLIRNGYSLEFVRIWLKHRSATTTKRYYTRYRPGELLDVACVMANLEGKFLPYDSNPESLRQNPELHELDGLKTPFGEPLYGYCIFREFCPRFGHCYTCGFHVASADKLPFYKSQLERLWAKKTEVFNYGSTEMLNSYTQIVEALEGKVAALEAVI